MGVQETTCASWKQTHVSALNALPCQYCLNHGTWGGANHLTPGPPHNFRKSSNKEGSGSGGQVTPGHPFKGMTPLVAKVVETLAFMNNASDGHFYAGCNETIYSIKSYKKPDKKVIKSQITRIKHYHKMCASKQTSETDCSKSQRSVIMTQQGTRRPLQGVLSLSRSRAQAQTPVRLCSVECRQTGSGLE